MCLKWSGEKQFIHLLVQKISIMCTCWTLNPSRQRGQGRDQNQQKSQLSQSLCPLLTFLTLLTAFNPIKPQRKCSMPVSCSFEDSLFWKYKYHMISLLCGIWNMTQMNLPANQKQTHRHRKQTCGCQGGAAWERDGVREAGASRCRLVDKQWTDNKVLLYSTENQVQYPMISHSGKNILKIMYILIHIYRWITLLYSLVNTTS